MRHRSGQEEWQEEQNSKELQRISVARLKAKGDYDRLRHAVRALHDAAFWSADRPCDAHGLWTEVKFAAGIN